MNRSHADPMIPAILGGSPVRPGGPPRWPLPDPEIERVFSELIRDGTWGRYHAVHTQRLTERLAERHNTKHVILTSSGTAAVELALRSVRIGEGDEVILSAYDFKANFTNVVLLGALPVLVDISPDDAQVDVGRIQDAMTRRTKAILVSHLHGGVVDLPELMGLSRQRGIAVIEDACQLSGAITHGQPAGMTGDLGVISFGGSKLLTSGRGGAVLTNRDEFAQRIRLYTQRGNEAYPLSELQAAVLIPQLERLDERRRRRREAVDLLHERLSADPALEMFHTPGKESDPDFYKVGLWYRPEQMGGLSREQFSRFMQAEGIPIGPGFRSLHKIHGRRRFRAEADLPHADRADSSLLVLHHPLLLEGSRGIEEFITAVNKLRTHAATLLSRSARSS